MATSLVKKISQDLQELAQDVILIDNPDGFFFRKDVVKELEENGLKVITGTRVALRIAFELRHKKFSGYTLILLSKAKEDYLEDMLNEAICLPFHISSYLSAYHTETILACDLQILDKLYERNDVLNFSKSETEALIHSLKEPVEKKPNFDLTEHKDKLDQMLNAEERNWLEISVHLAKSLSLTIDTEAFDELINDINYANTFFQEEVKDSFSQTINSNALKKPKVVSKIQDFLAANYLDKKVALVVVDGMAYWQYLILKQEIPSTLRVSDDFIFSWIPSITQLSRQAIFRGGTPLPDYTQNPINEERLWRNYWSSKKVPEYEVKYDYQSISHEELNRFSKYALVFKDLDEKMHSSSDYVDLEKLTRNWVKRSSIVETLQSLSDHGFTIFLTTDHGNIQARGWRQLKGKEKLGANKSGSRSARHIEYADKVLADNFLNENAGITDSLVREEDTIYFNNDLSFSTKSTLVTHGGSHIFEVIIPFIKIEK